MLIGVDFCWQMNCPFLVRIHPELEKVVQHLELDQILLETDSPYITVPVHSKCNYNTPYGLEEVARQVVQLKDITVKEVLQVTSKNAKDLYGLK